MKKPQISLRKYKLSDLDRLCELFIDDAILDSLGALTKKQLSKKKEKIWIKSAIKRQKEKKPNSLDWVIEADNEYVGGIGIHDINWDKQKAEIGYWIGKNYWGQGIATKAVKQLVKLLFKKYKFMRISGLAYVTNLASQRVLEKAGFKYEGTLKKNVKRNGKFFDDKLYAIVR